MRYTILAVITVMALAHPLAAMEKAYSWQLAGEVRGGFGHSVGYYASETRGTYSVGAALYPFRMRYLKAEVDFSFCSFPLAESGGSRLTSYSIGAGPLFYYPLLPFLHPYAGVAVQGSRLHLDADYLNRSDTAYKLGVALKAGVFIPLGLGVSLRGGVEYSYRRLSKRHFHVMTYSAGVSFNYNLYRSERKEQKERERIDRKLSREMEEVMEQARQDYERARQLADAGRYYEAIPFLKKAAPHIPEAKDDLDSLVERLMKEVPLLERQGIAAYENREYRRCIALMRKIKLVDPDNRTVKIYLPRALKRYNALQKLK